MFSRETEQETWFWRLGCPRNAVCKLETQGRWCNSIWVSKLRGVNGVNPSQRAGVNEMSQLMQAASRKQKKGVNSSFLHPLFCSGLHRIEWVMPTQPREGSLLSPLIQMLISSGNTLTDPPRSNVLPGQLRPVKLTVTVYVCVCLAGRSW